MNEAAFILAVLLKKKLITVKEARELNKVASNSSLNNKLEQMLAKVDAAIEKANAASAGGVEVIDAKELFSK